MPSTTASQQPPAANMEPTSTAAVNRPPRSGPSSRHPTHRRPAPQQHSQIQQPSSSQNHGGGRSRTATAPGALAVERNGANGGTRQPLRSMASLEVLARESAKQASSQRHGGAAPSDAVKEKARTGSSAGGAGKTVAKKRSHGKNLGAKKTSKFEAAAVVGGGSGLRREVRAASGPTELTRVSEKSKVEAMDNAATVTKSTPLNPSAPEFSFAIPAVASPAVSSTPALPTGVGRRPGSRIVSDPVKGSPRAITVGSSLAASIAGGSGSRHPLPSKPTSLPTKPAFLPQRPLDDGITSPPPMAGAAAKFASLTAPVPSSSLRAQLPTSIPLVMRYPSRTSMPVGLGFTGIPDLLSEDGPDSPPAQVISSSLPPLSSSIPSFASLLPTMIHQPMPLPVSTPATTMVQEEDLTPRTQRRVAGQGLKKAMSEAALRRRASASSVPVPVPVAKPACHPFIGVVNRRIVSDPHKTPVQSQRRPFGGAHRRSVSVESTLKKLPLVGKMGLEDVDERVEEDEEGDEAEKENAVPLPPMTVEREGSEEPGSPSSPSPRPSIVSLPDIKDLASAAIVEHEDEDDGDMLVFCGGEETPMMEKEDILSASPPSPAAMLLSASFASWPADSMRPGQKAASKKVKIAFETEGSAAQPKPEETAKEDEIKRTYVPKPLLLPSKLARTSTTSSSTSTTGPRSPKTSTSMTGSTSSSSRRSHVRAATLAGVSLSFSALAEEAESMSPRTGFQGRRESFVGITGSPVRRRFGPAAGVITGSAHSRRSSTSVISLSPPASPTIPLSPRRLRGSNGDGSIRTSSPSSADSQAKVQPRSTSKERPSLHSRSISVTNGWRRERPGSVGSALGVGVGSGFMKSIEEAEAMIKTGENVNVGSGNGLATVSSSREAVDEATAQSSPLLPSVNLDGEAPIDKTYSLEEEAPLGPKGKTAVREAKSSKYGDIGRKERLRPPPTPVPVEQGYCSLQELLEQAGALHTRVISPDRKAIAEAIAAEEVGSPSPSPPISPKVASKPNAPVDQALRAKTSILGLLSAVKDAFLPPASPNLDNDASLLASLPDSPPGHGRSNSGSTMSSLGAQLNGKSPELEAAERAVRGRIAGWVQHTQECLLDDLRPTVLLPGQKMVGATPVPAAPRSLPLPLAFTPEEHELDSRPFKVGSPPPLSFPATKRPRRHLTDGLAAPKLVKRASSELLRKPSMPVLSAGVFASASLTALNSSSVHAYRAATDDDFVLIHDVDGPGLSTFENVSATEVHNLFDSPPIASSRLLTSVAASKASAPTASAAVQALRRQGSVEGLARAKLGKLLELDEERMIKRKKSLGALAYGPPPRIVITES